MKPILILPPEQMTPEDIERLRENQICVVEAKDPSLIRFCETPPAANYDRVIEASVNLTRYVSKNQAFNFTGRELMSWWAVQLMAAHPIREAQVDTLPAVPKNKPKR